MAPLRKKTLVKIALFTSLILFSSYAVGFAFSQNLVIMKSLQPSSVIIISCDTIEGWSPSTVNTTLTKDTSNKIEGSASLLVKGNVSIELNRIAITYIFATPINLQNSDISFLIKPQESFLLKPQYEKRLLLFSGEGQYVSWAFNFNENAMVNNWDEIVLSEKNYTETKNNPDISKVNKLGFDFQIPKNMTTAINIDKIMAGAILFNPLHDINFTLLTNVFLPVAVCASIVVVVLFSSDRRKLIKSNLKSNPSSIFIIAFLVLYLFSSVFPLTGASIPNLPWLEIGYLFLVIGVILAVLDHIIHSVNQ